MKNKLITSLIAIFFALAFFGGNSISYASALEGASNAAHIPTVKNTLEVGDVIFWGSSNVGTSDERELCWTVANVTSDASGVKYQLYVRTPVGDHKTFSDNAVSQNWADSTLRAYMNGELYNTLFAQEEKDRILDTELTSQSGMDFVTTTDKLYLFSCADLTGAGFYDYRGQPTNPNHIINSDRYNASDQYLRDVVDYGGGAVMSATNAEGGVRSTKRAPLVYRRANNFYPIGEVTPDDRVDIASDPKEELGVFPVVTISGDDLKFVSFLDRTDMEQTKVCYRALNIKKGNDGYTFFGKYSDGLIYKTVEDAMNSLVLKVAMEEKVLEYIHHAFGDFTLEVKIADHRQKFAKYLMMMTNKNGIFAFDGDIYPSLSVMLDTIGDRIINEIFNKLKADVSDLVIKNARKCKGELVTNYITQSVKEIDDLDFSNTRDIERIYNNALAVIKLKQKCQLLVNSMTNEYNALAKSQKYTLETVNTLYSQYNSDIDDIINIADESHLVTIAERWAAEVAALKVKVLRDGDNSIKNDNGFDTATIFSVRYKEDNAFLDGAMAAIAADDNFKILRGKSVQGIVDIGLTLNNASIDTPNASKIKIKLVGGIACKDYYVVTQGDNNEYNYYQCESEDGYIVFNASCGAYIILAKAPASLWWAAIPGGIITILVTLYFTISLKKGVRV